MKLTGTKTVLAKVNNNNILFAVQKSMLFAGMIVDILDTLGEMYNFTWTLDMEKDGDWGAEPKTGEVGWTNATWGGHLGAVRKDQYADKELIKEFN